MGSERDVQDLARLVDKLRTLRRTELAQCVAEVVDDMVSDKVCDAAVLDLRGRLCKHLGVREEEVRRALH